MNGAMIGKLVIAFLIAYALGDINPAIIFGKIKGIDIRKEGSGNAGTQSKIQSVVKNATVKEVLAITGTDTQKDPDSVKTTVTGWLNGSK